VWRGSKSFWAGFCGIKYIVPKIDDNTHKYLDGKDVGRYWHKWNGAYLQYGDHLAYPASIGIFSSPVIIVREIPGKHPRCLVCAYSDGHEVLLFNRSNIAIINKDADYDLKYLLGVLNSSLMSYYFMRSTPKAVRKLFPKVILLDLKKFPIKIADKDAQRPIILAVDNMLDLVGRFIQHSDSFLNLAKTDLGIAKPSQAMNAWHTLDKDTFMAALEKDADPQKLSLTKKSEWLEHFESQKAKADTIKAQIMKLDAKINRMVYDLYGLDQNDIAIVESGGQ